MMTTELKKKIVRQVEAFNDSNLEEFYGVLLNFIQGKRNLEEWDNLSLAEKEGIYRAIDQIDSGKGILHEKVIKKYRKKYK
jgi:hypothetical protein